MNINNLLNLMGSFFNNNESAQSNSTSTQSYQNDSDYPDVFFSSHSNHINEQTVTAQKNNNYLGNMFNQSSLSQLLPLILNMKGSTKDYSKIFENLNPQFSQILSILSSKKSEKIVKAGQTNNGNIIDISSYKEIN